MIEFQTEIVESGVPTIAAYFKGKDEEIAKELLAIHSWRTWFQPDLSISGNIPPRFRVFLAKLKKEATKQGYERFLY